MMEKGGRHDNTVTCEHERDLKEGDDVDEKGEKSLEKVIEEKLEKELSVDVDVRRRGPILWISTGSTFLLTFANNPIQRRVRGAGCSPPTSELAAAVAVRLKHILPPIKSFLLVSYIRINFLQVVSASALAASSAAVSTKDLHI